MAECQSVSLTSFVAQVRGVMFYGLQLYGARQGEHVVLVRRPNNPYDRSETGAQSNVHCAGSPCDGSCCAPVSVAV